MHSFRTIWGSRLLAGLLLLSFAPFLLSPGVGLTSTMRGWTHARWLEVQAQGPFSEAFEQAVQEAIDSEAASYEAFLEAFIAAFEARAGTEELEDYFPESLPSEEALITWLKERVLWSGAPPMAMDVVFTTQSRALQTFTGRSLSGLRATLVAPRASPPSFASSALREGTEIPSFYLEHLFSAAQPLGP